jgi:hypothetical protein
MCFVIAMRLRYQHHHTGATQERLAQKIRKAVGVHPPTNVPGAYGAPGSPGAPLFFGVANLCSPASHFAAPPCNMRRDATEIPR